MCCPSRICVPHCPTRTKKRITLQEKLFKITNINDMDNTDSRMKNILDRPLMDTEKTVLGRRLNNNYRNAKKTDFLAVLEKNNGLMEEVQQTTRQMIVPTLSKKGRWNTFNTEERKALERLKKDRNI
eukprot:g30265.t1